MLTFQEFEKANEKRRVDALWKEGVFLALTRKTGVLLIDLYAIHDFYVEVYFDSNSEELLYIKPFISLDRLAPYLELMNICDCITIK